MNVTWHTNMIDLDLYIVARWLFTLLNCVKCQKKSVWNVVSLIKKILQSLFWTFMYSTNLFYFGVLTHVGFEISRVPQVDILFFHELLWIIFPSFQAKFKMQWRYELLFGAQGFAIPLWNGMMEPVKGVEIKFLVINCWSILVVKLIDFHMLKPIIIFYCSRCHS